MTLYYFDVSVSTSTPFQTGSVLIPSDVGSPYAPWDSCPKCYAIADNLAITLTYSDAPTSFYSLTRVTTTSV